MKILFSASLESYITELAQTDGAGLTAALVLVALQLVLSPRTSRYRVRGPLILLFLHVLTWGLAQLFEATSTAHESLELTALFLLLCAIGRSLFFLITESLFSRYFITWPKIFVDILHGLVYVAAFGFTLRAAGVQPGSLVTGSALLTAIIGLSLRDTLGNLFAGLAIQAQRPFEVGDWIQFDQLPSHIGQVIEINWRATKVITLDAVEIIIPNATLGQGHIINFTKPKQFSRRNIYIHAPYEVPPQQVQQLILEALEGAWGVLRDPSPSVVTNAYDERGVQYWVRFFTAEFGKRDVVDSGVRDRIWYALHRQGINIPAPLRTVQLEQPAGAESREQETLEAEKTKTLRCVDFLTTLSDPALATLATLAQRRLYGRGETIIRQGDRGKELFIIQSGEVAVTLDGTTDAPLEVARLGPGSFFGEMSLLTGEPRSATVRASGECRLLVVDKPSFAQVLEAYPEAVERISETIAGRQAKLTSKQNEAVSVPAPQEKKEWSARLIQRIKEFFSIGNH